MKMLNVSMPAPRHFAVTAAACGVAVLLSLSGTSHAATVTNAPGPVLDSSVPPIGSDGYFFPYVDQVNQGGPGSGINNGSGTDLTSLPSYVASLSAGPDRYSSADDNTAYSDIVINGITYNTGLAFQFTSSSAVVATITLGATVPAAGFQLGILGDNADAGGHSGSWIVSSTNNATQATTGATATNNFYLYNLTNLSPNDVITVTATIGTANIAEIGGLTFDAIPEPSSLALAFTGAVGLLIRRRRNA